MIKPYGMVCFDFLSINDSQINEKLNFFIDQQIIGLILAIFFCIFVSPVQSLEL